MRFYHLHSVIGNISSPFCHPHFSIRILSSAFCHPPSAIRRHPVRTLQRPPLRRHGYKQSSKLSQLQNTQLNLLTATFVAKPALIFRWWKSKTGKRLTIRANFQEGKKISIMDIQPYVSLHSRGSVCYVIQADKCSVLDFGPFVWQLRFVDKTWQTRRNVVRKSLKVRPTATLLTKSSTLSVKWRLAKHFSKTHRR